MVRPEEAGSGAAVGRGEGVPGAVAANVGDLAEDGRGANWTEAVEAGQPCRHLGHGGVNDRGNLPDLCSRLGQPDQPAADQLRPHAALTGEPVRGGSDERRCGQPRDLGLVAGQQAVQLGVGAVGQRGPLGDQLSAVVGQRPQVSGLTDRQPYRRQVRLAGGDPGDRDRINRIGPARTRPTGALPAGQAGQPDSETAARRRVGPEGGPPLA